MTSFKCTKCRYEFRLRNPEKRTPPARCPYCAASGTVMVKQHIVKELFP